MEKEFTDAGLCDGDREKPGISERKHHDVYQQHDAAYNKKLADEFGMKVFHISRGT